MKKALALVVGNGIYDDPDDHLDNAVNDAKAISKKLHNLGFEVILKENCNKVDFEKAIKEFENKLAGYDVALFYYSGHAFQIERENYLSAIDSDFQDSDYAKFSCVPLHLAIMKMDRSEPDVKIIILDACRNNPLKEKYRGGAEDLAPVKAPTGSIIAFSTSPGEKAADYGKDGHSIYTGCLLKHLEDPDIPIEVLFKRVRVSVNVLSRGKQTPWEHTSMINDFYFHRSGLVHATDFPYDTQSLIYEQFVPKDGVADHLIIDLLSSQYSDQNDAAVKVYDMKDKGLSSSECFLLGRAVLSAANYGSFRAQDLIKTLTFWVTGFDENGENHLLNGILFEIYFDRKGLLRKEFFKSSLLDTIFQYEIDPRFEKSFAFLRKQLKPHTEYLFYLPGDGLITINLIMEESIIESNQKKCYRLQSMTIGSKEFIETHDDDEIFGSSIMNIASFQDSISKSLLIPKSKQNIISAFNSNDLKILAVPTFGLDLAKVMREHGQ